ncbi:general stress protein [Pleurocapsa sp. FMAR1]|uniref:general stress protein n=1 Tax=Pleurocapsa sp. FMAR1 TaxID=3040204 RepID=UPI0029C7362E|nr:general stress protein [Pleurocapsa sp. FMAR1]
MNNYKRSVGLFYSREEAEKALRALKDDGFDMNRVNVIAKDADQVTQSAGVDTAYDEGNNAAEGAGAGASSGAVLGGIGGLLVGLGTLAIPGIGPIIVAGQAATTIATTLAGAGIGAVAGGIIGGLVGLGIPEDKAKIYSDRVSGGSYLVMVNGTDNDISRAERILHDNGIEEYGVYDAHDIGDDTYNTAPSTNRVNTNQSVTSMGDIDRSMVLEPNTTGKVMDTRTDAIDPTTRTSDRTTTTDSDADVIVLEPNTTGKVMDTRTDAIDPTTRTSDRTATTDSDADVIVVEPRDNV